MIKLSKLLFENENPFSVEEFLHQCEIVLSKVHDWIEQNSLGLNPIMELDGEYDDLLRKNGSSIKTRFPQRILFQVF